MNETEYDELIEQLDKIFPNAPFSISCFDSIDELHDVFSEEKIFFIYDNRANPDYYYYSELTEGELMQFNNYTKVTAPNGTSITFKDVIEAMINDQHYHSDIFRDDPHNFLEGFDKSKHSDIQFTPCFGS